MANPIGLNPISHAYAYPPSEGIPAVNPAAKDGGKQPGSASPVDSKSEAERVLKPKECKT